MFAKIEEATKKFAADVQSTNTYQEYRRCLHIIKQDSELYERVNEYRLKNFELQTVEPVDGLLDKIDRLEQEYEEITGKPEVSDFLRAELAFCRMMQQINNCISDALEFE